MNTTNKLLLFIAVVSMITTIPIASATGWALSGIISRSDGGVASGATVSNGSNTSTTNASGWYSLNMSNNTEPMGWVLTISMAGFEGNTTHAKKPQGNTCHINNGANTSCNGNITIYPTVNSAITESTITKNAATLSWTVNHTNGGNRIIYGLDSGLVGATTLDWQNSTASPSFNVAGLIPDRTYYYRVESYNQANGTASSDTDTGDFTTLKAGSYIPPKKKPAAPVQDQSSGGLASIIGSTSGSSNMPATIIVVLLIIGVAWKFDLLGGNNKGGGGHRKKKK